jgi:Flp pilus assembly pilin Flp
MKKIDGAAVIAQILSSRSQRRAQRRGQTLVEYALILAIISVVAIGVLINMGQQVRGIYSNIDSVVASAQASH